MKKILLLLAGLMVLTAVEAQPFERLTEKTSTAGKVFYSPGFTDRSEKIVNRIERAMTYYQRLLEFRPEIQVLILSKTDWKDFTSFPVYGMPHYDIQRGYLILAAEDNAFWQSFIPAENAVTPEMYEQVWQTYKKPDGKLSMEAFFDLLALHELGHAFHYHAKLNMQRKWMGELFVNVLLHTWVAEEEPAALPALTVFPTMVIASGAKDFTYTSLQDIETYYEEIGKRHPRNYGWYQSRWHAAAGDIYSLHGKTSGKQIWNALQAQSQTIGTDEALGAFFEAAGAGGIASMMRNWDKQPKRP